jgi:hypothetical protein
VSFTPKLRDIHMLSFAAFHEDQKPMLVLQQTQERIQVTKLLSKLIIFLKGGSFTHNGEWKKMGQRSFK